MKKQINVLLFENRKISSDTLSSAKFENLVVKIASL